MLKLENCIRFEEPADQGSRENVVEILNRGRGGLVHKLVADKVLRTGPYGMNIAGDPDSAETVTLEKLGVTEHSYRFFNILVYFPQYAEAIKKFLTGKTE